MGDVPCYKVDVTSVPPLRRGGEAAEPDPEPVPIALAPPPPPPVRLVADADEFAVLAPAWDAAVMAGPGPAPFVLHGWLAGPDPRAAAGCAAGHSRRRYGRARRGGSGARDRAPRAGAGGAPPVRRSRVARRCDRPGRARRGGGRPGRSRRLACDVVAVTGLLATSRIVRHGRLHLTRRVTSPLLRLDGGFEAVVADRLTKHDRHDIRRRQRRLAEIGTVSVRARRDAGRRRGRAARRLPPARAALGGPRRPLRPAAPRRPDVPGGDERRAGRRRPLLVHRICLDGTAIAFRSTLVLGDRAFAYRMAFDPAFAYYAPGPPADAPRVHGPVRRRDPRRSR